MWFKTHDPSCASFHESIVIKIKCFLKSDEASFDTKCLQTIKNKQFWSNKLSIADSK